MAPRLAARFGVPWEDLDDRIARAAGRSVSAFLRSAGETVFRAAERNALADALRAGVPATATPQLGPSFVLACGGGIVTDEASRGVLAAGAVVVWLTVRPETALERLGESGVAVRPLLEGGALERLRALDEDREALYREIAALTIETDNRTPDAVADVVAAGLRKRWATSAS